VSKDRLDVMMLPQQQCFSVRNDGCGWDRVGGAAARLRETADVYELTVVVHRRKPSLSGGLFRALER
jgi:hypothetical protein